jgi:hypothetical protein
VCYAVVREVRLEIPVAKSSENFVVFGQFAGLLRGHMVVLLTAMVLSFWFALSVLYQVSEHFRRWARDYDRFRLLPSWTLFAPRPGISDYHLLFRDRRQDGHFSQWTELHTLGERNLLTALWNPEKRFRKWLFDVGQFLSSLSARHPVEPGAILGSVPYHAVWNLISQLPRGADTAGRQFVIVETQSSGTETKLNVILRSAVHELRP